MWILLMEILTALPPYKDCAIARSIPYTATASVAKASVPVLTEAMMAAVRLKLVVFRVANQVKLAEVRPEKLHQNPEDAITALESARSGSK